MADVAVIKTETYEEVRGSLERGFDLIAARRLIQPGTKVLIKPNLLKAAPPEKAVSTHPTVVKALVELVRDLGATPWVGESSGGAHYGNTSKAFKVCGIEDAARDAAIKNFDTEGVERVSAKSFAFVESAHIARPVVEADVVISAAKLKTHLETLYTGAVKNMMGCIPGSGKLRLHQLAPKPRDLAEAILDVYAMTRPRLSVIDAVVSMEGDGPGSGTPKQTGFVVVGEDGLAADAVASAAVGFDPGPLYFLASGERRGLGCATLSRLDILGDPLAEIRVPDFKKPSNLIMRLLPNPLLKLLNRRFFRVTPEVLREKCADCGLCEKSCPVGAIQKGQIDRAKCIECFCCYELCPHEAVKIRKTFLVRMLSQ